MYSCVAVPPAGWVHPNLNLSDPEPEVDLNVLVGKEKEQVGGAKGEA